MLDEGDSTDSSAAAPVSRKARIVGWMVSFDFSPTGQQYTIREGKTTMGRGRENDCSLFYDGKASDQHAVIIYRGGVCKIKDNASTHGTYINGNDVGIGDVAELKSGDVLTIGDSKFWVVLLDLEKTRAVWPDLGAK